MSSRTAQSQEPLVWLDGELRPLSVARVSPLAHALHYGTGVFEGLRSYATANGPAVFRLPDHLARMKRGAELLGFTLDEAAYTRAVLDVLRANALGDAYIRPLAFHEAGGLGLDLAPLRPRHLVAAMPWTSHLGADAVDRGVRVHVSSYRRNPAAAMPALKLCGGYVNSVLAKHEAARAGCDEALFVDDRGFVCEATGENVFLVRGGNVVAVAHADALPGITRATLVALTGAVERAVTLDELRAADEIFLTGTSAEVTRVRQFDGRALDACPVTRELQALYARVVRGTAESARGWLTLGVDGGAPC